MEKLNKQTVVELFNSKGYEIVGEYKNVSTPVICEKDGYRYRINYANLKAGKNPSLWGFSNIDNLNYNILSMLDKRQSKSKYLGYEIVQKNQKKRILVHFECSCGKRFDKLLEDAVYGTHILCRDCQLKARGKNKRLGKKIIDYIESKGYKVFDKRPVYKNTDYIEVEDKMGFRGYVTYNRLKNRNSGMSKFDVRINRKYYVYNVNRYAELQGIDVECLDLVEEKLHTRQSLKFRCSCGNEFVTSISSFQNGKTRCDVCAKSISRYEYTFEEYLKKIGIEYIYQYSYNQCRDILPLPFDFFIKQYNCLVEIDGEGHYHPCNFNQIGDERALTTFNITKKHDEIKNLFCKENNIPLLRIPYQDFTKNSFIEKFQKFIGELANSN